MTLSRRPMGDLPKLLLRNLRKPKTLRQLAQVAYPAMDPSTGQRRTQVILLRLEAKGEVVGDRSARPIVWSKA